MVIGELERQAVAECVELWRQAGLTRPWNDPEADLRRAADGSTSTVLAIVEAGALLATAVVGHDGHRGWMYYLAVAPSHQRSGLGRQMVRACEQELRVRGVPKIQLMVRAENAAATAFYRRLGYDDAGVAVLGRWLSEA